MRVWDPCVRLIHWSVATLVLVELLNEAGANPWHRYLGYAAAALVVARLAWGFGDTGNARLSAMARNAGFRLPADVAHRHTPLGVLMAFTLWALLLLVALTGWMLGVDEFRGDERVQDVHEALAYVLAGCAAVHIGAALLTSHRYRVNLVKGMITGER